MRDDRPSSTALLIAAEMAMLSRDPRLARFVPAGAGELSRKMVAGGPVLLRWMIDHAHLGSVRHATRVMESLFVRGLALQHVLRKRWVEERTRDALGAGYEQVVVIAAGFDTLATRLAPEYPTVSMVETDHPATQRLKASALEHTRPGVTFVAADLARTRLDDALARSPAWNPLAPTLFIAEGLLMYLEEGAVERVFSSVRGPTGARRRVLFTFMERAPNGRVRYPRATPLVDAWLRLKGEPFRWGLEPRDAERWLAARGFEVSELAGADDLRRRYLAGTDAARDPVAAGEWLCAAGAKSACRDP